MKRVAVPAKAKDIKRGRKLKCPECGELKSFNTSTKTIEGGTALQRSLFCIACHHRYTTIERIDEGW